jgi:type VI secretion system protein ImpB
VLITYDVETRGGMKMVELPFIVGVMGDFSGKAEQAPPPLKERKFIHIDKENFDEVMERMAPHLQFKVKDRLSGKEDRELGVELRFKNMRDFDPKRIVDQVEPLREIYETRQKLLSLMAKMDGNDKLDDMLEQVLKNPELRDKVAKELGMGAAGEEAKPADEPKKE